MTGVERLSVNISAVSQASLLEIAEKRGESLTETVRRAIAILKSLEDATEEGVEVVFQPGRRRTGRAYRMLT